MFVLIKPNLVKNHLVSVYMVELYWWLHWAIPCIVMWPKSENGAKHIEINLSIFRKFLVSYCTFISIFKLYKASTHFACWRKFKSKNKKLRCYLINLIIFFFFLPLIVFCSHQKMFTFVLTWSWMARSLVNN